MSTSSDGRGHRPRGRAILGWLGGGVCFALVGFAGFALAENLEQSTVAAGVPLTAQLVEGPRDEAPPATADGSEGSRGPAWVPRRLVIASLGMDATVVPIGTTEGVLVPPSDPQQLGWWRDGALIGSPHGSVLVTGHTVHTGGGALDRLGELAPGDGIVVGTRGGMVAFRVLSVTSYPKQTLAAQAGHLFSQSGPNRLVVVTCDRWNGTTYDANTVVVAVPVG